jgi:acetyltransferase EpsM
VKLGDFTQLGPRAVIGGGSTIGDRSYLGLGSSVRDHLTIGAGVMIAMGAVVTANVSDGAVMVGVPARAK